MLFTEIIKKKVDKHALNSSDIQAFIEGLLGKGAQPEQLSALCMAILFNGMNAKETGTLIKQLANSGTVLNWDEFKFDGPVVDKHSTGGVGDKTSFAIASIMAACGAYVPMISGRGLGHTGGTLDKLESIPGYSANVELGTFKHVVAEVGCAIVGQTAELAPAEGRLYSIRDVTSTVESIPLICASIVSKKYAAGNNALVMDIKVGNGAFIQSLEDSRLLAKTIINASAEVDLKTTALITDMSQILGRTAGNALEVHESVRYLKNEHRDSRLDEVTVAICSEMLLTSGLESDPQLARQRVEHTIFSGQAAEKFSRMVYELGGPQDFMEKPDKYLASAAVVAPVFADEEGFVGSVDVRAIGNMIVSLGGGRRVVTDKLDHTVGLSDIAAIGEPVGVDRPIATLHASNQETFDMASSTLKAAYGLSGSAKESEDPIVEYIK